MTKELLKIKKKNGGYTIIETMVSLAVFIIIITTGMTALLNAGALRQKSQNIREAMDNLSFIMDDMAKNIRTGSNYHCLYEPPPTDTIAFDQPESSPGGKTCWGIVFTPSGGGNPWVYYISSDGRVKKSAPCNTIPCVYDDLNSLNLSTQSGLKIDLNTQALPKSGFKIIGAEAALGGDKQQPYVMIRLVGTITSNGVVTPFNLETSASQRQVDI